jgi:hypothetical protein
VTTFAVDLPVSSDVFLSLTFRCPVYVIFYLHIFLLVFHYIYSIYHIFYSNI